MEHNCIICMYDDHYEIVGPFESVKKLAAWGEQWQEREGDRPTWQSVYLTDPSREPAVIHPRL